MNRPDSISIRCCDWWSTPKTRLKPGITVDCRSCIHLSFCHFIPNWRRSYTCFFDSRIIRRFEQVIRQYFVTVFLYNIYSRMQAQSITVFVIWAANCIIGTAYPPTANAIGSSVFFIFAGLNLLAFIFVFFVLPETKNKTSADISVFFKAMSMLVTDIGLGIGIGVRD